MKKQITPIILLIASMLWSNSIFSQGIAIGEGDSSPHASAIMDLQSTQHGLLIPRMTTAQRGEIKSPAEGLLIYNTTSNKLDVYTGAEGWYSLEAISDGASTGSTAPGGGMSVNETGADPHDVAILDVSSTEKGFLLPRTEPTTVSGPTESLIIFNNISKRLTIYDGSDWTEVFHNAESTVTTAGIGSQTGMLISNTGNTQPHHSAILELRSTNGKGLLVPRMTTAQRNALAPVQGLIIYNTETQTINYCTGTEWHKLHDGSWACGDNITFSYNGSEVTYGTVESNGRCWLDRNLGAIQIATSSTDANAYGDLFQWGRLDDGHQVRNPLSGTTATNSSTDNPGHSNFITEPGSPYDWRVPQNANLWQGVNGTNNPCPAGWRVPTEAEWNTERLSWDPNNNATGAINSPLKLPMAGLRHYSNGSLYNVGSYGYYWSSGVNGTYSRYLRFTSTAYMASYNRGIGFSLRCIKDCPLPEQATQGTHTPSETQIIWNWNTAAGADGYKYNTVNDYATATDNGASTSYTQEGLDCGTTYILYVWAYNDCGNSTALPLTQTTSACIWEECGDNITFTYNGSEVTYGTVESEGKCWLDRNLGATAVAISSTHTAAYGDLFQWGRGDDGHQNRSIASVSGQSSLTTPTGGQAGKFLHGYSNWYNGSNPDDLWQGVSGTNNPCPSGWRVPTEAEWHTERLSWTPNISATGAINSPLKLPLAGRRSYSNGSLLLVGSYGFYWSSTVSGARARSLYFFSGNAYMYSYYYRAVGLSVRCLKD